MDAKLDHLAARAGRCDPVGDVLAAQPVIRADDQHEVSVDELEQTETELLNAVHAETSEFGLLSRIAFRADGQLVSPNGLPDEWHGVRAPFVLALAIRRLRLLHRALGTRVSSVDVDPVKDVA